MRSSVESTSTNASSSSCTTTSTSQCVGRGCLVEGTGSDPIVCPEGTPEYDGYWSGGGPYGILVEHADASVSDLTVETRAETEAPDISSGDVWAFTAVGGAPTFERVLARHIGNHLAAEGSVFVHQGSAARFIDSEFGGDVLVEQQSPVTLSGNSVAGLVIVNTNKVSDSYRDRAFVADYTPEASSASAQVHVVDNDLIGLEFAGPVTVDGNKFRIPATGVAVWLRARSTRSRSRVATAG
jgi:hypothetical protein